MKNVLLLLVGLSCAAPLMAQKKHKMDFTLRHFLEEDHAPSEEVDLFIHGDAKAVADAVRAVGGRVKLTLPKLLSVTVPVDRVNELSEQMAVRHFEFRMDRGELMNDSMRVKNRVDQVHAGLAPLVQGYDGSGVVMGFIDSGMDVNHPDLRDENGNTRVLRYWDQVPGSNAASPMPFGYGREWTSAQLDAGGPVPVEPPALYGHGTNVIGVGTGNGLANGRHKGVAPKAGIIVVATNFARPNWTASVADGVAYIIQQAEALGRPAVINTSVGTYLGSHDGKDAAAVLIQNLLDQRGGRVMVTAAGNSNSNQPYHMQHTVDADTAFTWFHYNSSLLGSGGVFFEVWSDVPDFRDVRFAIGADRVSPSLRFRGRTPFHSIGDVIGGDVIDTLYSFSGNRIGVVEYYAQQRGGQYLLQVLMASDSTQYPIRFETTGRGKFDVWGASNFSRSDMHATGPTPGSVPNAEHYVRPDRNKHMVDSWACLSNVITVANYCNEVAYTDYAGNPQTVPGTEGDISLNSSAGPTRDERMKPDIAATGDVTFTPGPLNDIQAIIQIQNGWKIDPGGMHMRNGGTSIASPVVAGAAALYLQRCPNATAMEVVRAVQANARQDAFTGAVPNNRWGSGKLDVFNTVVNKHALNASSTAFCEGSFVEVSFPGYFESAEWSNGEFSQGPLTYGVGAPLSALLTSPTGCVGFSDTLSFELLPAPPVPVIVVNGNELTSSVEEGNQWYWNDELMEGAVGQVLEAERTGAYVVEVVGDNDCTSRSEAVTVLLVGLSEAHQDIPTVWPSPAQEVLHVSLPGSFSGTVDLRVTAADGRLLLKERRTASELMQLPLGGLPEGTFTLSLHTEQGHWHHRFIKVR